MLGAFAYLTVTSARNRLRQQLRRLRSPRYVVALLFALAYFGFVLLNPGQSRGAAAPLLGDVMALVGAMALVGLTAYWWAIGSDTNALAFTPAELQFLFPAPVTRRQLIQFKLVRAQLVILLSIVIWSLLLRRGEGEGALAWVRPLSLWVLFSTMQLHRLGATLARTSMSEHGGAGLRRGVVPLVVVTLLVGAVAHALWAARPTDGLSLDAIAAMVRTAAADAPARWALLPFRLPLEPLFAADLAAWARAMPVALAIMLAHFAWVVRADAAFEEAAVEASLRRAARAAAWRSGAPSARRRGATGARRTLPLRPVGDPAVAIVWKNLFAVTRGDRFFRQLLFFAAAVVALSVVAFVRPASSAPILGIIVAWAAALVLLGPLWVRNDLRGDLPRLDLLRTWPVPPVRLVAAEIASSALVLTVLELLLGVALFVALLRAPGVAMPLGDRVAVATAAALALPALNLLSASIHNAAVLLLPGWLGAGTDRRAGIEGLGQMYLTMFASLLLLAVLLAVPAVVGAIAGFAAAGRYGAWSALPAVAAGSLVAAGELWLILRWLGRVFARTEPADVAAAA